MRFSEMDTLENDKAEPLLDISRDLLARMVASHKSKTFNAVPEQEDFDDADEMIKLLNDNIKKRDICPRCGGDHSWCNIVQPGEYGPED